MKNEHMAILFIAVISLTAIVLYFLFKRSVEVPKKRFVEFLTLRNILHLFLFIVGLLGLFGSVFTYFGPVVENSETYKVVFKHFTFTGAEGVVVGGFGVALALLCTLWGFFGLLEGISDKEGT